jgi:hypothetical protein
MVDRDADGGYFDRTPELTLERHCLADEANDDVEHRLLIAHRKSGRIAQQVVPYAASARD